MSELQQRIFKKTEKVINALSYPTMITSTIAISFSFLLVLFVWEYELNPFVIGFALFVGVAYSFIKEFFRMRSTKRNLKYFYDYLANKKVYLTLYIPIFSRIGTKMTLKAAALFFVEDKLFFEAIKLGPKKHMPMDSITLNIGKDFIIQDYQKDVRKPFMNYKSILMDTDYEFSVVDDEELINMIERNKEQINEHTTY